MTSSFRRLAVLGAALFLAGFMVALAPRFIAPPAGDRPEELRTVHGHIVNLYYDDTPQLRLIVSSPEGEHYEFLVGDQALLQVQAQHLKDHARYRWPVTVTYVLRGQELIALAVDD